MKTKFKYIAIAILLICLLYSTAEYFKTKKPDSTSLGGYIGKVLSFITGKAVYEWPAGEIVKMRGKSAPVKLENLPKASENLLRLKGNFELFSSKAMPNYISYRVIVNYKQVFYKEGFCINNNIFPVDELIAFEHPKEGIANITIAVVGIGGNGNWLNDGEIMIPKDFKIEVE